ncbi:hypothetical protein [Pseudomonas plecoglossicida]
MLIDDDGFDLGMPTHEEMLQHQLVVMTHESEQVWQYLAKANRDIRKLTMINAGLNKQVMGLQREVRELHARLLMETASRRHGFSTWGGQPDVDRVPGSGVTEPAEGALRAKEDGHRGSWLTLSLRRPNTHQRNHDDQAHYRIDRVG